MTDDALAVLRGLFAGEDLSDLSLATSERIWSEFDSLDHDFAAPPPPASLAPTRPPFFTRVFPSLLAPPSSPDPAPGDPSPGNADDELPVPGGPAGDFVLAFRGPIHQVNPNLTARAIDSALIAMAANLPRWLRLCPAAAGPPA
jgi:hypothetical protein